MVKPTVVASDSFSDSLEDAPRSLHQRFKKINNQPQKDCTALPCATGYKVFSHAATSCMSDSADLIQVKVRLGESRCLMFEILVQAARSRASAMVGVLSSCFGRCIALPPGFDRLSRAKRLGPYKPNQNHNPQERVLQLMLPAPEFLRQTRFKTPMIRNLPANEVLCASGHCLSKSAALSERSSRTCVVCTLVASSPNTWHHHPRRRVKMHAKTTTYISV